MLTPSLQPIVSEYFTQRRERLTKECAKVCLSQKPLLHPSTILTDDDDTIREEDDAPISEEIPKRWVGRGASWMPSVLR